MDFTEHRLPRRVPQGRAGSGPTSTSTPPGPSWSTPPAPTTTPTCTPCSARQGLLGAGWPAEYGGTDVDPDYALAVFQEIGARGLRMDGWVTTEMVTRTILHVATEEAKQAIVPAALRGEVVIVLGYTEPGSGSDVAAAKMRAVRDGDEWVVNGSKMFTSTAHMATHVFLLTRTNTEVPKHKGLTLLLAPARRPRRRGPAGAHPRRPAHQRHLLLRRARARHDADRRRRRRLGRHAGGPGARAGHGHGPGRADAGRAGGGVGAARPPPATAPRCSTTRPSQEQLARLAIDEEVGRLLGLKVRWVSSTGGMPGIEGSMQKLHSSEAEQRRVAVLTDLLGRAGAARRRRRAAARRRRVGAAQGAGQHHLRRQQRGHAGDRRRAPARAAAQPADRVSGGTPADVLAVMAVLNRYAWALDTRDWEGLREVFAEDLRADYGALPGRGRRRDGGADARCRTRTSTPPSTSSAGTTSQVDGDTARSRC